ncbi:hypothetical protein QBC45DRAFT_48035 [Copromyces sp. CBS 386.78]|nr:hypothetical protein QBC45DRAFT_48035 [Copromyces sp. CBS 386.78]
MAVIGWFACFAFKKKIAAMHPRLGGASPRQKLSWLRLPLLSFTFFIYFFLSPVSLSQYTAFKAAGVWKIPLSRCLGLPSRVYPTAHSLQDIPSYTLISWIFFCLTDDVYGP